MVMDVKLMVVLKCPICDADIEVSGTPFEGDLVECDSCGEFLELKRGKKGRWNLQSVDEDWEEDEEPF